MSVIDKRSVGEAIAVPVGAFVALNLAFVAYALFVTALDAVLPGRAEDAWVRGGELVLFAVLVAVAWWRLFGSRLPTLGKAIAMTVPLGVVYATIGILLYPWPVAVIAIGILVFAAVLAQLRRAAQPWVFAYALVIVSLAMLAITVTATDI